jgi:hypothetical protein
MLQRTSVKWEGKGKGKFVPVLEKYHAMMTYWENVGTIPSILNLGTR